jgi:hypothetical protein
MRRSDDDHHDARQENDRFREPRVHGRMSQKSSKHTELPPKNDRNLIFKSEKPLPSVQTTSAITRASSSTKYCGLPLRSVIVVWLMSMPML